jgi:hypothetical protein
MCLQTGGAAMSMLESARSNIFVTGFHLVTAYIKKNISIF